MIELSSKQNCTGCSACANICPRGCIKMTADEEGFLYPEINEEMCMAPRITMMQCALPAPAEECLRFLLRQS